MQMAPVILYRYDASPFAQKVDNVLLLKAIPHQRVQVAPFLPRSEITEELGINYRRIPILAIGNDVYCDTSLIVSVLERRFPPSQGYGTLFPAATHRKSVDRGLVKLFSKFYADNALFGTGSQMVPWEKVPIQIVRDRGDLRGAPINTTALAANRDTTISQLASHLTVLEEQFGDGREWLFDTALPGLADLSVHFILAWVKSLRTGSSLYDEKKFPRVLKWLEKLSASLQIKQEEQGVPGVIKGPAAGDAIFSSEHEPDSVVGFDPQEGRRLRLQPGDQVRIVPDDTGRNYPTTGKLVALSLEEVVLEIQSRKGKLRCHFPRLGYLITKASNDSKL